MSESVTRMSDGDILDAIEIAVGDASETTRGIERMRAIAAALNDYLAAHDKYPAYYNEQAAR